MPATHKRKERQETAAALAVDRPVKRMNLDGAWHAKAEERQRGIPIPDADDKSRLALENRVKLIVREFIDASDTDGIAELAAAHPELGSCLAWRDEYGRNSLHYAAEQLNAHMFDHLARTAPHLVNREDYAGNTPIRAWIEQWAKKGGWPFPDTYDAMFEQTLAHCIPHESTLGQTVLHYAATYGVVAAIRYFHAHAERKIDHKDNADRTALMYAAANGHVRAMQFLLAQGADSTLKDVNGLTALELVPNKKHPAAFKLLQRWNSTLVEERGKLLV